MLVQGQPTLMLAVTDGNHEVLDLLLAHGAKPNVANSGGNTPLESALRMGDRYAVRALLAHGADPGRAASLYSIPPYGPYSPLVDAIPAHMELVPDLLAAGADINAGGSGAPLKAALRARRFDLVRYLLKHGARADRVHSEGAYTLNRGPKNSLLDLAIRTCPAAFETLLRAGADITPDRPTILLTAATYGRADLIPKLVALGADVNAANSGETVLTEAVARCPSQVKLLLEHGAKPDVTNSSGATPLMLAAEAGKLDVAQLLIAHGADVNAMSPRSHTALYTAGKHHRPDMIDLLQKAGATVDR
jgi:hypothetical protein